ncbi:MAG: hypothetical protein Kow0069_13610 [Promethearchaeota archaeon]
MSPRQRKGDGGGEEPPSVAEATRRVIDGHPSLLDALRKEVVNYTSLAEHVRPAVAHLTGKPNVKLDSIKMALMRYADTLRSEWRASESTVTDLLAATTLELKNDLVVFILEREAVFGHQGLFKFLRGFRFFQLVQGTNAFTLLADEAGKQDLLAFFPAREVIAVHGGQSALILTSPVEIINTPGFLAHVSYQLAKVGVNVTHMFSCHTDTVFIVDRKQALEAYEVLERRVMEARRIKQAHQA